MSGSESMRTTMFHGQMKAGSYDQYDRVAVVEVPTLSAYAVEYADFTPPLERCTAHPVTNDCSLLERPLVTSVNQVAVSKQRWD